ncbi:hypothetical protein [Psychrobacter sp. BI730]|uniref:hypothetical protein n=1 Tax=Psychrobacter sp. BI730 TaxID=2705463 RepID=UPI0015C83042|nr:hypothetical protein [Psychrobacter sp. BI730]NYR09573.1 hypothetical protein [Psychrobacter sp. BI730]
MDIDSFDNALHEMLSSNYNIVEYGSSDIELNDDSDDEFNALVDMLTLQITLSVISDLNLPDLRERLNRAHTALLDTQSKEMQDDPFNEELLGGIVERIMSMRDTK